MAKPTVTMEVGNDGVAVITMSNPPVNALAVTSESDTFRLLGFIFLFFYVWILNFCFWTCSNCRLEGEI